MKKLLFNYCVEKFVSYEQQLLEEEDFKTALIALSLSKSRMFRRFVSGCTVEELCFSDPYYLQDLFLVVCADAIENGDNVKEFFNFKIGEAYHRRLRGNAYIEDWDISRYIETIFRPVQSVDYAMYEKLLDIKLTPENIQKYFSHYENLRGVNVSELQLPETCEATEMFDRAWERLLRQPEFRKMFVITNRHSLYGKTAAYDRYMSKEGLLI